MGCASCGQRYTRRSNTPTASHGAILRRSQIAARRAAARKLQEETQNMSAPDETKREVFVQPDTPAGVVIPPSNVEVEPATGIAISVIKTGEGPTSLGDTTVKPITVANGLGQGD